MHGAGEIAQQFRALAALVEDADLIPSSQLAHNYLQL